MLNNLRNKWKQLDAERTELQRLRRFTKMFGVLAADGEVSVVINDESTVTVHAVVDGQRVRLCQTVAATLEQALFEAVIAIHNQGNCACHVPQQTAN